MSLTHEFEFESSGVYLNAFNYGSVMSKKDYLFYPAYYDNRGNLNVQINNSFSRAENAANSMADWLKSYIRQ